MLKAEHYKFETGLTGNKRSTSPTMGLLDYWIIFKTKQNIWVLLTSIFLFLNINIGVLHIQNV